MGRQMQPGWYPDPEQSSRFRWWSGTGWTPALTDDAYSPPPLYGLPQVPPGRTFPWVGVIVTVLVVGLLATLTVIGVGYTRPLPGGSPAETPSFGPASTVNPVRLERMEVDRLAKTVTAFQGAAKLKLPPAPWNLASGFCDRVTGLMLSGCVVYDASFTDFEKQKTLQPTLLVGVMDPKFTLTAGVEELARDGMSEWHRRLHRAVDAKYEAAPVEAVADYPGHPAARATSVAEYDLAGKHHRVEMTVLIIEIRPGAHLGLMWLTDSLMKPATRTQLEAAIKNLAVT